MTFTARTVAADDPNLAQLLDAAHELHVAQWRPWWNCAGPVHPWPSRNELDRMVVQSTPPLTLVVTELDGELVGYHFHSPEGVILAGYVAHNPEHQGYVGTFDQWALDLHTVAFDRIRANTGGTVFHVAYACPAIWHAFEVELGVPGAPPPYPQAPEPTPTEYPAYAGPPAPTE